MRDLNERNKRGNEMSQDDSFFLCSGQSARHFDVMRVFTADKMLESARHLTVTDANSDRHNTVYICGLDVSPSYSASQYQQVTHDA